MNRPNTPPPGFVAATVDPDTPAGRVVLTEYAIRYDHPPAMGGYSLIGYGDDLGFARRELAALFVPEGRTARLVHRTITITPWAPVEA